MVENIICVKFDLQMLYVQIHGYHFVRYSREGHDYGPNKDFRRGVVERASRSTEV